MVPSDVSIIEGSILVPNAYVSSILYLASTTDLSEAMGIDPRTELDSHVNMAVLGKNCFVFDNVHGHTCDVAPYDSSIGTVS